MSDPSASPPSVNPTAVTADATTAAGAVSSNTGKQETGKVSLKDTFSSMGELKKKYPKLYELLMEGSIVTFIQKQEKSNQRIKEINREARERNG